MEKRKNVHKLSLNLPTQAMKLISGAKDIYGSYTLAREGFEPQIELTEQVFPQIKNYDVEEIKHDTTALKFRDLLLWLSKVFIQDTAVLIHLDEFKNHILFQNSILKAQSFLDTLKVYLQENCYIPIVLCSNLLLFLKQPPKLWQ